VAQESYEEQMRHAQQLQEEQLAEIEKEAEQEQFDFDKIDMNKLPVDCIGQLSQVESLLESGVVMEEEATMLRNQILEQAKEYISEYDAPPMLSADDYFGFTNVDNSGLGVQRNCEECGRMNIHSGAYCTFCYQALPDSGDYHHGMGDAGYNAEADYQQQYMEQFADFGPPDGNWDLIAPYKGGEFRCFLKEPDVAFDRETFTQKTIYVIGCQWVKEDTNVNEIYNVQHSYRWFRKFVKTLRKDAKADAKAKRLKFKVPSLSKIDKEQFPEDTPEGKAIRKENIAKWLGELFDVKAKAKEKILNHESMDTLFKLSDNCLDKFNMESYQNHYMLQYNQEATNDSLPLDKEEMQLAGDAAALLVNAIRGSATTRPVDIRDPTVIEYKDLCQTLLPRVIASKDVENEEVDQELIPEAFDVEERINQALNLYSETLVVMNLNVWS